MFKILLSVLATGEVLKIKPFVTLKQV